MKKLPLITLATATQRFSHIALTKDVPICGDSSAAFRVATLPEDRVNCERCVRIRAACLPVFVADLDSILIRKIRNG